MKECKKCKEIKALSDFDKNKSSRDGLQWQCKECRKRYRVANSEMLKDKQKLYRELTKDGLHHVYYLPEENWVGTTNYLPTRMINHRVNHGRNTDNFQILASFTDRGKALRFESLLHDSGFNGRHRYNTYF